MFVSVFRYISFCTISSLISTFIFVPNRPRTYAPTMPNLEEEKASSGLLRRAPTEISGHNHSNV